MQESGMKIAAQAQYNQDQFQQIQFYREQLAQI